MLWIVLIHAAAFSRGANQPIELSHANFETLGSRLSNAEIFERRHIGELFDFSRAVDSDTLVAAAG